MSIAAFSGATMPESLEGAPPNLDVAPAGSVLQYVHNQSPNQQTYFIGIYDAPNSEEFVQDITRWIRRFHFRLGGAGAGNGGIAAGLNMLFEHGIVVVAEGPIVAGITFAFYKPGAY